MATFFTLVVLSIVTFYLLNVSGEKLTGYVTVALSKNYEDSSFNLMYRIIGPNICMILYGLILSKICDSELLDLLWLIIPLEIFLRFLFNINRLLIINPKRFIISGIVATIISYYLNYFVISNYDLMFPSLKDIIGEFWLIIAGLFYVILSKFLANYSDNNFTGSDIYIERMLRKFEDKFAHHVNKVNNAYLKNLVYSIIIVENFNRPFGVRFFENLKSFFYPFGTYGIMQTKTDYAISDEESVIAGVRFINDIFQKILSATASVHGKSDSELMDAVYYRVILFNRIAWFYNRNNDYADDVIKVYNVIQKMQEIGSRPSESDLDIMRLNAFFDSPWK